MDREIQTRLGKASSAFGGLYHRLWNTKDVSLKVKIDIYKPAVISALLYGAESWTLFRQHINQLNSFHMHCLRSICGIKWQDKARYSDVLQRCNITGIEAFLIKIHLRWAEYLVQMDDTRVPKQHFYG